MAKAKRRRARKRHTVNRSDRVAATPETLAKLRPCPLKAMLERPDLGFDPEHYEACLAIWAAHDYLTRHLKASPKWMIETGDRAHDDRPVSRADHMVMVLLAWWRDVDARRLDPDAIIAWIDDSDPRHRMFCDLQRFRLIRGADRWIAVSEAYWDRQRAARNTQHLDTALDKRIGVGA